MKKEIVISEADNLAAVIEDGRAVELFLRQGEQLVGDIILGQVESVVQGIEAAFVNIGQDRNGFIHMADLPSAQSPRKRLKNAFVRPKELLLVQIAKAPTGTKGARLTGRISIPGRFVVFVSHDNRVNISRRIINPQERDRLRQLTYNLKDPGHGLIIRTEAEGASEEDLKKDIEDLIATWSDILHQAQLNKPPMLLFRDQDLLTRVLREAASHDTTRIVVDSQSAALRAKAVLQNWMPEMSRNVALHRGPQPIMKQFNLDREIKNALQQKVHLPSGGSLDIESTQAFTAVDVNSGRLVGSRNLAETVLRTNLEAATELARQLRLRDIGGVVVVDFISMDHASDQQKVLNHLHEAMKPDKARPQIGAMFSEHGLLEISRRRQGQNLLEQLTSPCPHCKGVGRVRNEILTSTELLPSLAMEEFGAGAGIAEMPEIAEIAEMPEIAEIPELVSEIDETEEMELAAEENAEATPEVKKRRRRRRSRKPREAVAEILEASEEPETLEAAEILEEPEAIEAAEILEEPEVIEEPEILEEPEAIEEPEILEEPEVIEEAEILEAPEVIEEAEVLEAPEMPRLSGLSEIPEIRGLYTLSELPKISEMIEAPEVETPEALEIEGVPEVKKRRPRRRTRKEKEAVENVESVEAENQPAEPSVVQAEPFEVQAEPVEVVEAPKKRPARRRSPRPKVVENEGPQDESQPRVGEKV